MWWRPPARRARTRPPSHGNGSTCLVPPAKPVSWWITKNSKWWEQIRVKLVIHLLFLVIHQLTGLSCFCPHSYITTSVFAPTGFKESVLNDGSSELVQISNKVAKVNEPHLIGVLINEILITKFNWWAKNKLELGKFENMFVFRREIVIEITDCEQEEKSIRNKLLFMCRKTQF